MAFSGPKNAQRPRYGHFYDFGTFPLEIHQKSQWAVSIGNRPKYKSGCNFVSRALIDLKFNI